ncbi:transposase [Sinorhizobium sp. A49]|nr:transposase [Sinorhizobium sp. A49]
MPRGRLADRRVSKIDAVKQGSEAFTEMRRLAMRSAPLEEWIDAEIDSELISFMRFARELRRDIVAVNNAIEMPWSNGQPEGQTNRLKALKLAVYGKAGPELLRARMLPRRHTK